MSSKVPFKFKFRHDIYNKDEVAGFERKDAERMEERGIGEIVAVEKPAKDKAVKSPKSGK